MTIEENVSLNALTTFKIGGKARYFCRVFEPNELQEIFAFAKKEGLPVMILGGGSNVLVSDDGFQGVVVLMSILGIDFREAANKTEVVAGAGESWDYLVSLSVEKGLGGLENLSGIPGTVGAAPVQNIGAYGAEAKDAILWVEVFDPKNGIFKKLLNKDCQFGYRDSYFKNAGKGLVITRVAFALKKSAKPNISYQDLSQYFGEKKPSLTEVRAAVLSIREKKFALATKYGTAGSFFKNPVVSEKKYEELKKTYPEMPAFKAEAGRMKVSLAWLIDKVCGLKGYRQGKVGISPDQALVIINYGGAKERDVKELAEKVFREVKEKTGIEIEAEVRSLA